MHKILFPVSLVFGLSACAGEDGNTYERDMAKRQTKVPTEVTNESTTQANYVRSPEIQLEIDKIELYDAMYYASRACDQDEYKRLSAELEKLTGESEPPLVC